jgi:hypothetical protein
MIIMTQNNGFNPNEHLMQLKSKEGPKDYLPVAWRLVWFREQCPQGTIDTEEVVVDLDREVEEEAFAWNKEKNRSEKIIKRAKGYARFKAVVTDGKGGRSTGTKSENAASFPDYIEKAETGAIGRALAGLGYGTAFTGDEFEEHHRIVDSPLERSQGNSEGVRNETNSASNSTPTVAGNIAASPITDQQITSIRKICPYVKRDVPENLEQMGYLEAKALIQRLTSEYNVMKQKSTAKA